MLNIIISPFKLLIIIFSLAMLPSCYLPLNILPPQYLTRVRLLYSSDSASLNKLMPYISILILCIAPLLVLGYDFILSPLSQNAKYPSRHEDSSHSDSQVTPNDLWLATCQVMTRWWPVTIRKNTIDSRLLVEWLVWLMSSALRTRQHVCIFPLDFIKCL